MYVTIHLRPFFYYSMIFYRTKFDNMGNEGGLGRLDFVLRDIPQLCDRPVF